MDSIFEEDADAVGGEIEAYCPSPRCKADTTHTIISMYEDEVRRVQCVVCGEVHAYRKPRGDGEGGEDGGHAKSHNKRLTWDDAMARASDTDLGNARPYSIRDSYEEGDVVLHPTFDVGFVIEQLPDNCVAMVFRNVPEPKRFIHNRGVEYAARMPEIAEIPVPREAKKKKRSKKVETPPAPIPARNKAEIEAAIGRARAAAQNRMDEAARNADEHNKKLKADAKKLPKPSKAAAKAAAKPAAPAPAARPAKAAPAAAAKKPAAKAAAAPAKKPVAKAAAKKPPAKKAAPKKPAKPAKPAKKPAKAAAKKPAKKAKKK
jgi:Zn ribbon nucleic-acid-binding protein